MFEYKGTQIEEIKEIIYDIRGTIYDLRSLNIKEHRLKKSKK